MHKELYFRYNHFIIKKKFFPNLKLNLNKIFIFKLIRPIIIRNKNYIPNYYVPQTF